MSPRQALGKGLGALIPTAALGASVAAAVPQRRLPLGEVYHAPDADGALNLPANAPAAVASSGSVVGAVPGAHFAELPIDAIIPNARQPREHFAESAMDELVHSIREVGLLQPIVVRPVGAAGSGTYELIMGERRWRASRQAGLDRIPAIVRETEDTRMLLDALLENLHRSELNPLEEAAAYDQLLKDFGCTHDQLADRIGRARTTVTNTLRLLKLAPKVQRWLAVGNISAGHARALLAVDGEEEQLRLLERVNNEQLSVRDLEAIISAMQDREGKPRARRKIRAGSRSPILDDYASRLSDRLETRVKVESGSQRGRIVVEFAANDDLVRIMNVLLPSLDDAAPGTAVEN